MGRRVPSELEKREEPSWKKELKPCQEGTRSELVIMK